MRRLLYLLFLIGYLPYCSYAQSCKTTARFINTQAALRESIQKDSLREMVDLKALIPSLIVEMPYATPGNFTKTILYNTPVTYLRRDPAIALKSIQEDLHKRGISLKIYDAFRPFSVSCKMWQLIHDTRYVANPEKGSGHNRGLAVDVTLVNLQTGKELDMGTAFDSFTDSAHHTFINLSEKTLNNRKTLKASMERYGFKSLPTEWWHYSWSTSAEYEVIDLDFKNLSDALH